MTFFNFNLSNVNSLKCVSMNKQQPMFYPFSITINKCKGSCNANNDPYAKLCVP